MAEQLVDDVAGNVLGERRPFQYVADNGTEYNVELDNSIAVAVGNDESTDAGLDRVSVSGRLPLAPRYINVVATGDDNIRKRVVIGSATNPLFVGTSSSFTANGVTFSVLSSRGERRSRVRLPAEAV